MDPVNSSNNSNTLAIQQLAASIARLPDAESLAYRQALSHASSETLMDNNAYDPQRFLICEQHNSDRAARRLCRYWKERELWWTTQPQPPGSNIMDSSVAGVSVLPNHRATGCSVLLWDPSRLDEASSSAAGTLSRSTTNNATNNNSNQLAVLSLAKALFSLLHRVALNPLSQTQGFHFLVRKADDIGSSSLGGGGGGRVEPTALLLLARMLQAFPVHVRSVHLLAVLSPEFTRTSQQQLQQQQNLWQWKQTWETVLHVSTQLHIAASGQQLGTVLEQQEGFSRAGLPVALGGTLLEDDGGVRMLQQQQHAVVATHQLPHDNIVSGSLPAGASVGPAGPSPYSTWTASPPPLSPSTTSRRLEPVQQEVTAQELPPDAQQQQHSVQTPPSLASASENDAITTGSDSADMQEGGLSRLQEAIQFLPHEERSSYQEALERCPDLVQSESNPIHFLRYEGYDPWAAAKRLSSYWMWRKKIFKDRAFLPISMTGDGALSAEDIVHVRRGYFSFLPQDSEGRTVICYDPSRRARRNSKETRMRVGFYYWQVMCENEMSRRDGYVGIVLLGTSRFDPSSLDGAIRECAEMVMQSFPTHVKNMHLVQCPGRKTLLQMLLPILNYVMGRIMENRAVTHVGDTPEAMMQGFAKFGLLPAGIPQVAGGRWSYDNSYVWQLERCKLERRRPQQQAPTPVAPAITSRRVPDTVISNNTSFSSLSTNDTSRFLDHLRKLPGQGKASALDALNKHPNLVETEACPQRFVDCHRGDTSGAAHRFALYWTVRCALFGDKAFHPMTQTGEGALSRNDLTILSSGFLSILPTLKNEPVVVCYDVSKQVKSDRTPILRVLFYLLHVASENALSCESEGVSVIVTGLLEDPKEKTPVDFGQVLEAIPVNISNVHFAHIDGDKEVGEEESSLDDAVAAMRRKFGTVGDEKALVQVGHNKDELFEQLSPFGILHRRDILPKSLGGMFGFDRFVQWQELRTRFEWGLPAGVNDSSDLYDFSGVKPLSELNPEERKERKRRMNVVHSKRKRERERIVIQVLQEQCAELKEDNRVLLRDKQMLENLVDQAGQLLAGIVSGAQQQVAAVAVAASTQLSNSSLAAPAPLRPKSSGNDTVGMSGEDTKQDI